MRALVARRDQPLLGGDPLEGEPARRDLDAVDAAAPRVVRHVAWRLRLGGVGEGQQVGGGALAEVTQVRSHRGRHVRRQQRSEQRAEQRIAVPGVAETRSVLEEVVHDHDAILPA